MNAKTTRSPQLTPAHIRARLAGTAPPADPGAVAIVDEDRAWPQALLESFDRPLLPAAVLIPIIERAHGLTVLLTERAADLKHHPGQVSFPGGRVEQADTDLAYTALRETHEEVGIEPSRVEVTGYLNPLPTITGYAVTPVVGLVDADVRLLLDRREVASAFEVPLDFLLEPRNRERTLRPFRGIDIPVITYRYQQRRIWGATAAMIVDLQNKLILKQ